MYAPGCTPLPDIITFSVAHDVSLLFFALLFTYNSYEKHCWKVNFKKLLMVANACTLY